MTSSVRPRVVYADANELVVNALRSSGLLARLDEISDLTVHLGVPSSPEAFVETVGDADIVIFGGTLPDQVLEHAPRLVMAAYIGQGAANFVNLRLAARRGIAVAVTPNYGSDSVAEHALALLLAVARRIVAGDRHLQEHRWRPFASGLHLSGRTAGIVGFGSIGAATAKLFGAVGMKVIVWTRNPPAQPIPGVTFVGLDQLVETADVLSLHLALTDETRGLISGALLDRLKPGSIVINTARAELIEPDALESRLQIGTLSAGLDVFTTEPLEQASPLRQLDNVVLSPHQAYNTPDALVAMLALVVDNIENYTLGRDFHCVRAQTE
ncbi:NAD(P)-dependent oxidoreductase [Cryobacterium sp. PH29-G1]|uniref:2-hydroxyacid dehydrogenase n=1 Tax=Cryobacterium sp. PH29-G1 TaxID=3046211 RepID=UPI0024BAFF84|nr:NAD(P)-dependent oxidoreductase [Cryobacterium sp. PH29-G1]MDJ0348855.1 NAD(P)-dependent oxidoreductase [Cryobacterium sp. PH29-G1]